MKKSLLVFALLLIAFSFSACTQPAEEEEVQIEVDVYDIYPASDNTYSILVSKSLYDQANYEYIDSLLFIQVDTAGNEIACNSINFQQRPNIREKFLLNNGNIMLFGNMNSDYSTWYFSTRVYTPTGTLVWEMDMADQTNGVVPAINGDLFVLGWSETDSYYDNIAYARMESDGDTLWSQIIEMDSTSASVRNGTPTSDGGCIAIGYMRIEDRGSDILVAKINSNGDTLWTGTYGGDRYDDSYFVTELSDGSFLVVGGLNVTDTTNADWRLNSGEQVYLIKLAANGDKLWTKAIGNTLRESPNAILEASDGSLILLGIRRQSYAYLYDEIMGWISKLSADGEEIWIQEFENKLPMGIRELPSGDFIAVTSNLTDNYYQNAADLNIIKLTSSGTLLWNRVLTP